MDTSGSASFKETPEQSNLRGYKPMADNILKTKSVLKRGWWLTFNNNISLRQTPVLPGPDKHSRPHSPKTTAIFEPISKHNDNKKQKNNVWGGILSFFYFCSPFLD
jgi:hypothetical protein